MAKPPEKTPKPSTKPPHRIWMAVMDENNAARLRLQKQREAGVNALEVRRRGVGRQAVCIINLEAGQIQRKWTVSAILVWVSDAPTLAVSNDCT